MDTAEPRPRIAELRRAAGLTQLQLSQRVGVTETTIANWERGRGGIDWIVKLIRLCDALNCTLKDLVEYEPAADVARLSLTQAQELIQAAEIPPAIAGVDPAQQAIAPSASSAPHLTLSLTEAQHLMSSSPAADPAISNPLLPLASGNPATVSEFPASEKTSK